jgi:hypothetical protein
VTKLTTFNPTQTPSFARSGELSATAKALTGGGSGISVKRISVKGGVFRLIAGGKEVAAIEDRHLDVVIVNAAPKVSRTYYEGQYVEGEAKAPDCWSADGNLPDASIKEPQAPSCATCPMNIKGSGQGDSRACRFSQRLAVVLANDVEGGDVMQLTLSATSIFGKEEGDDRRPLQAYARYLAAQNISPEMVVTQLKFDTKAAVPKLFFKPARWLDDTEYAVALEKGQSEDATRAVTMTVAQADNVKPPAPLAIEGKRPTAAKPKPYVQPVEPPDAQEPEEMPEVEPVAEVEEPAKRKSAAKPTAVPKKATGLAAVVDNWDADDE